MRHAHQTFPWFLALTLCSLSACSDLFRVPACEFSMDSPFCSNSTDPGMGQHMGGSMPDGSSGAPDMTPRPPMKGPVSFTQVFTQALTPFGSTTYYNWVGIYPPNITVFAKQAAGSPNANFEYYQLKKNSGNVWVRDPFTCKNCLLQAKTVNLNNDIILASNTTFFVIRPPSLYSIKSDGSLSEPINSLDNPLLPVVPIDPSANNAENPGFRPFSGTNFNLITYQEKIISNSATEIFFYKAAGTQKITFAADSVPASTTYYYAIGPLNRQSENLSDNKVLIFKDNALAGAYSLDASLTPMLDQNLTNEINTKVISVSNDASNYPVRSISIADFNQDGYMDMIYARHNNIFITSYNPDAPIGSRFTNWQMPTPTISINTIDHTQSVSVTDFNGDGFPDLALEVVLLGKQTESVYLYLNNAK